MRRGSLRCHLASIRTQRALAWCNLRFGVTSTIHRGAAELDRAEGHSLEGRGLANGSFASVGPVLRSYVASGDLRPGRLHMPDGPLDAGEGTSGPVRCSPVRSTMARWNGNDS